MTTDPIAKFSDAHQRDRLELLDLLDALTGDGDAPGSQTIDRAVRQLEHTFEERQVAEEELRAQQHQLEQALLEVAAERQRYRQLFEHAPVGYLVTDPAGMIRDVNRLGARILGDDATRLLGRPLASRVASADRGDFRRWLNELGDSRRPRTVQLRVGAGDEQLRPVTATVNVVASDTSPAVRWIIALDEPDASSPAAGPATPAAASSRVRLPRHPRVVVAHPQPVFRRALIDLFEQLFTGSVVLIEAEPEDAVGEVERTQADLVIVGASDGALDVELVRRLSSYRGTAVVVFGPGDGTALELLAAGAEAVLPADAPPEQVAGPMLAAMDGWATLPPEVHQAVVAQEHDRQSLLDGLDEDDVELLRLLARGVGDADISRQLHVSTRTAKRRIAQLYRRLGVSGRAEAAATAGGAGLFEATPNADEPSPRTSDGTVTPRTSAAPDDGRQAADDALSDAARTA